MSPIRTGVLLVVAIGLAAADPARSDPPAPAAPAPAPAPAATTPAPAPSAASGVLSSRLLVLPPLPPEVPSLRIEAARIAAERFEDTWRFPQPEPLFGVEGGLWFAGAGHYRPRSGRAAALHGGSMATTLLGEILMAADSPIAAAGAFLTGATLDAAAADADRAAESRR